MWFVSQGTADQILRMTSSEAFISAAQSWKPPVEEAAEAAAPRVAGTVATVNVHGLLTKKPSFLAWLMGGGTTYSAIEKQVQVAAVDPNVSEIVLDVDSPGGEVDGLFHLFDVLGAASEHKPINVTAHNALSAAYGVAAATGGKITAASVGTRVGSVGVVAAYEVDDSLVEITSTEAPNKRPDVRTEEGKAAVRAELDQMHALFAEAIAKGRSASTGEKFTAKTVNAEFGQGGTYLAADALKKQMIDAMPKAYAPKKKPNAADTGEHTMKFTEYAAAHPEEAKAAIEKAVNDERARCAAHFEFANKSKAYEASLSAIKSGIAAPDVALFDYMTAHLAVAGKQQDIAARQAETDEAQKALAGTGPDGEKMDADSKAFLAEFELLTQGVGSC